MLFGLLTARGKIWNGTIKPLYQMWWMILLSEPLMGGGWGALGTSNATPQVELIILTSHQVYVCVYINSIYRQVSNIKRTKSQHLKDSRTVLWLSLLNPLKPDVKSRMKM